MERHKTILNSLCRLCGKTSASVDDRAPIYKCKFARDIKLVFDIDVNNDTEGVHPSYICNCCRAKLQKWRRLRNKNKAYKINLTVVEYEVHSSDCKICSAANSCTIDLRPMITMGVGLGFSVQLDDEQLILSKNINGARAIKLSLNKNKTWDFSIGNKGAKQMVSFPERLEESSANELIRFVSKLKFCLGIKGFGDICRRRSPFAPAVFFNKEGDLVAQEEQCDVSYIRHVNCSVTLTDFTKSATCDVCSFYKSTLHAIKSKTQDAHGSRIPASNARNDQMTNELLRSKLSVVTKENLSLKRKASGMKKYVQRSVEEEGVFLQQSMSTSLEAIMAKSGECFEEGSPQKLLWAQQISAMKSAKTHRKWHPAIIRYCIAIHSRSSSAYRTLRDSGLLLLPHENTLRNYSQFTDAGCGFNPDVITKIKKDINFENLNDAKKIVTVGFDEMKIKAGLVYSKRTGNLVGFTDMGSIGNSLDEYANKMKAIIDGASEKQEPQLASHMLAIMVRGMFSPLHTTIGYFPSHGSPSYQLYGVIWNAIAWLEYSGFDVRAIVSDGASANRKFYRQLQKQSDGIIFSTVNPFSKKIVYLICDVPHLMKTTRNNFENSGFNKKTRNLHYNKQDIRWSHLLKLVEDDVGVGGGLRKLHKIKHEHLYLTPSLRMKVKLAVQVLSNSVAKALESQGRYDTKSTIEFISKMNKFFDCLNVSRRQKKQLYVNEDAKEYTSVDDPRIKWLEEDFLGFLRRWEDEVNSIPNLTKIQRNKMCLSPETLDGLRITVNSFVCLAREMLALPDVKYFLSEKLNQDPIEEYFSKQRGCGGRNENPTVGQFCNNALSIQVADSCITPSRRGNTTSKHSTIMNLEPLSRRASKK